MQRQRQRQRCTEMVTANGNGETATEERQRNGGNRALVVGSSYTERLLNGSDPDRSELVVFRLKQSLVQCRSVSIPHIHCIWQAVADFVVFCRSVSPCNMSVVLSRWRLRFSSTLTSRSYYVSRISQ